MRTLAVVGLVALPVAFAGSLSAQAHSPPAFIQIFREEVKVGRGGAHLQTEAGWPRAFGRAKIQNHYIAMTTTFGPSEAWFLEGHGSIAEIDAVNQAIEAAPGLSQELDRLSQADAANVNGLRTILVRFLPEASNAFNINPAEMRAWEVVIFRVRPGKEGNFFQGAKAYQAVVQRANATWPWATYEVMAGMPGPTYLVFVPHKSLTEIDPTTGAMAAIEQAMTDSMRMTLGTLSEGFISVETMVFTPSPEMSYPPPDWVAQDSKYWGRTVTTAGRPATRPATAAAPKP